VAAIDSSKVIAFLTETGGATSHAAILARSFGIPAVLGIPSLTTLVQDGQTVIVDGLSGCIFTDPDEETLKKYRELRADYAHEQAIDRKFLPEPSVTKDGVRISVSLNIGSPELPEDADYCDGIGLYRSEFLYMEKDTLPDEETQFAAYASVLRSMGRRPVILRTLDIGGDKTLPYLPLEKEQNPFLGNRAIRLCLSKEALFRAQLRAALRASLYGDLNIMFPMIGSVEDFRKAKAVVDSVWEELLAEGVPLNRRVPLGIMVEVPAAALAADLLAKEADFASIGTNDLCQYTFAADRMNAAVAKYAHPLSAPMLRLIRQTAQAFGAENKPVSVCGEMAGDKNAVHILVGCGIRKLSVSASALGMVKRFLRASTVSACKALFEKAVNCATEEEILELVASFRRENGTLQ
jgi:phosphotransferase system enzyme I (PtsI)